MEILLAVFGAAELLARHPLDQAQAGSAVPAATVVSVLFGVLGHGSMAESGDAFFLRSSILRTAGGETHRRYVLERAGKIPQREFGNA
ncbi:MAG: hypothetical protein J0L64_24325 [Acidobacteria bacterium]|nr:hypothetical protein [Acidobacteriota bacterium]